MTLPPNDLPAWMRPRQRRIDWGLLLVIGIGLLIDWPLAFWPGLPGHTDAALFVARAAEIAASLRSGTLYTRWAADFHFGYGSPLFNYLAPLPHYLSGLHQLITDANPVDSIKLGLALSVLLAGVGMYQFARQRYGQRAGLIAAVVYVCSTPIAYALPVQSGNLAMLLSLALLPWTLAALDRLLRRQTRREWLIALLLLTLWSLADTRLTVIGLPLVALVIGRAWPKREALTAIGWLLGAAALLTSFFWLPALVERDAVQWIPLAADPAGGAITLSESLGGVPQSALTIFNPPVERGLGLGFGLTTIAGAVTVIKLWLTAVDWSRRQDQIAFGLVGLAAVLLASPLAADHWAIANGWQPIRPYDLLVGLALPALTLVAAQAARWWPEDSLSADAAPLRRRAAAFAVLMVPALATLLPVFGGSPWIPVPLLDAPPSGQTEGAINAIDTLRTGLLLPLESYQPGMPLDRIVFNNPEHDPIAPVPNLLLVNRTPLESRFTLSPVTAEVNLTLDRLAFPGWSVVFNGVPAPNTVSSDGRMLFNVFNPIDTRRGAELLLIFGDTPIRYAAWFLTVFGLFLVLGRFLVSPAIFSTNGRGLSGAEPWQRADLIALGSVFGLFLAMFVLLQLPPKPSSAVIAPGSTTAIVATGTPTVTYPAVIAAAVTDWGTVTPGSKLTATLFWQAPRPISADWELIARLIPVSRDPNTALEAIPIGTEWHPGGIPTNQWPAGLMIRDWLSLSLPDDIAPGDYYFQVALAQCNSPQRLPCENPAPILPTDSQQDGQWLTLPNQLKIESPAGK